MECYEIRAQRRAERRAERRRREAQMDAFMGAASIGMVLFGFWLLLYVTGWLLAMA